MKNNLIIGVVIALILGVGGGFLAGMKYQQGQRGQAFTQQFGKERFPGGNGPANGAGGQNRLRNGGGQIIGDILSQDNDSITVKMLDGSSKIIILSGTTTISKASTGSISDLKVGDRVAVFGTTNPDGSVTATNVQLNPVQRNIPGSQNGTGSGTPR